MMIGKERREQKIDLKRKGGMGRKRNKIRGKRRKERERIGREEEKNRRKRIV